MNSHARFSMLHCALSSKTFRTVAVVLILAVPLSVAARRVGTSDRAVGGDGMRSDGQAENKLDDGLDSQLEREYRRQLFRKAAERVRSRADAITWQAFAITMIDGLTIPDAAAQLDRSEAVDSSEPNQRQSRSWFVGL